MYSNGGADCGQIWTRRVPKSGTCERVVLLGRILDTVDSVSDLSILSVAQVAGTADPKETRVVSFVAGAFVVGSTLFVFVIFFFRRAPLLIHCSPTCL
jgi:hypothetical protein